MQPYPSFTMVKSVGVWWWAFGMGGKWLVRTNRERTKKKELCIERSSSPPESIRDKANEF